MKENTVTIAGRFVPVYSLNTVVVGTGAAGYNSANRLHELGQTDIAIVTEHINAGTSRNTGSDKQTYYKLTLSGDEPDSVQEMAESLYAGKCVDGDIALCEAALSAQGFYNLVEKGVPFPRNRYGEYIGYKTDHDPRRRATSVGPYTSKIMTEQLEIATKKNGIRIFDKLLVIKIIQQAGKAKGLLCLSLSEDQNSETPSYVAFNCTNIVFATGGPAGMYANSVYPFGHYGATGVAFEAGVSGKNLTEWQYGLASIAPRWNVSGTYMQVLPRFISTNQDGSDEREFLLDFFDDIPDMLTKVFLKGYQWPFDVRKVKDGSSIIDILVYLESQKGRRVFLDFRHNPANTEIEYDALSTEAYEYLDKAGACFGTPYERLAQMNMPAIDFYRDRNVDLAQEPLEIALCAQHNNGGLNIDSWWQTNVEGLFAVGEAAASHGVYRPGGSALNAGQVGSLRAAQFIANQKKQPPSEMAEFTGLLHKCCEPLLEVDINVSGAATLNVSEVWDAVTSLMSRAGGAIRNRDSLEMAKGQVDHLLNGFWQKAIISCRKDIEKAYRLHDVLVCQHVYLDAMLNYIDNDGKSRGSALYTDKNGSKPYAMLSEEFTFTLESDTAIPQIQEIRFSFAQPNQITWRDARAIPKRDDFFENVWREYRETRGIG